MGWAVFLGLVGAGALVLFWRKRRLEPGYFAICEYWIYLPEPKLPSQDSLMDRMINGNPHNRPGRPCIGAREGMLFSDIRLHLGIAARDKNPHVFRPDLFETEVEPTAEILESLALSKGLAKVRYASEVPLTNYTHLQFCPHMAEAVADIGKGEVIFDHVSERLFTAGEFARLLGAYDSADNFDVHVRLVWDDRDGFGTVATRGLRKIGLDELMSDPAPIDQRTLVCSLLEDAARHIWAERKLPEYFDVRQYDTDFRVHFRREKGAPETKVSMHRRLGVPTA